MAHNTIVIKTIWLNFIFCDKFTTKGRFALDQIIKDQIIWFHFYNTIQFYLIRAQERRKKHFNKGLGRGGEGGGFDHDFLAQASVKHWTRVVQLAFQ